MAPKNPIVLKRLRVVNLLCVAIRYRHGRCANTIFFFYRQFPLKEGFAGGRVKMLHTWIRHQSRAFTWIRNPIVGVNS